MKSVLIPIFKMEVYNIVLITAVQHSDLILYMYTHTHSFSYSLAIMAYHRILNAVLWAVQ